MRQSATSFSSSGSFTSSSSEEEEPAEKVKVTKKGAKATQKAHAKLPSKTQTPKKGKGKRSLEEPTSSIMPPPASGNVSHPRRPSLQVSTSTSNTSVGANISIQKPTPSIAPGQELSSSSESETPPAKKEDVIGELNEAARKQYPGIPSVMNSPLIQ